MCKVLNSDEQRKKYKNVLKNGQTYFSRCFVRKNNGGRSNSLSDEEMQEALAFAEEKGIDRSEVESVTVVYNDEMLDDYVIISQWKTVRKIMGEIADIHPVYGFCIVKQKDA